MSVFAFISENFRLLRLLSAVTLAQMRCFAVQAVLSLFSIFESANMSSMKSEDKAMTLLEAKAEEVAATLSAMANPKRLLVMCTLLTGEKSVGDLALIVQLSPAALSQHLGKMRALRLVSTRRDGQTIYYSLASTEVQAVLETLYQVYCAPDC